VQNGQKFKIQGITQSPTRVSNFMRQLEGSGWFKQTFPVLKDNSFTLDAVQVTTANNSGAR
jgi:Tfp pilus assembly protein PilN